MGYRDFITTSLEKASVIADHYFGKVSSITKEGDNNQVLTEADVQISKLLVSMIRQAYPKNNVIDEEAGIIDNHSEFTWVIDPIDGTSNFATDVPTYGIMIGLLHQNVPIAGGVALPFFHEIYIAEKGMRAFCNGKKIAVSSVSELLHCLVAYGIDGHQENPEVTRKETVLLSEIILHIRNLRSSNSAFDIMQVAKGGYGAYLNRTSKIWDNVAPQIIIEEAGGIYTDFYGKSMDYTNPFTLVKDNFTVCAAPKTLHKKLQEIIYQFTSEQG